MDGSVVSAKNSGQPQAEELKAVQKVAAAFVSAYKYYSLYPEGHAFASSYLQRFKTELDEYLTERRALRLEISRNSLLYGDEEIFAGSGDENNPAYLLSRDRILFLQFGINIHLDEITLLLDILKRHRNPLENADGDIATTLWHHRFQHLHYEAADIFAMEAIQFDLSMFRAVPDETRAEGDGREGGGATTGLAGEGGGAGSGGKGGHGPGAGGATQYSSAGGEAGETPSSTMLLSTDQGLVELGPDEVLQLEEMVDREEGQIPLSDVVDVLLITLAVEEKEADFLTILEFLEGEYLDAMGRAEFALALKIGRNVVNIFEAIRAKKPWAEAPVRQFLALLARAERYAEMPWLHSSAALLADPQKSAELLAALDVLPEGIVPVLARLLFQVPGDRADLRDALVGRIAVRADREPQPFCALVTGIGAADCPLLLQIAAKLGTGAAIEVYLAMTRHENALVRKVGIDGFFRTCAAPNAAQIVHLLADRDSQLRDRMLSYLPHLNSAVREEVLLLFLGQNGGSVDDERHLLHCYRLLAGCCTASSLSFLERVLLEGDIRGIFNDQRQAHRTGAAYVLGTVATKEALAILNRGAESMWPDIRQTCRRALGIG